MYGFLDRVGGLAGSMDGLAAMGVEVPMNASSSSAGALGSRPTATLLSDRTILLSAPPGSALPPIPLSQKGWPQLPPESTAKFESVQPVTLQTGTTLFGLADDETEGGELWLVEPSASSRASESTTVVIEGGEGVRAWMGQAAGDPSDAQKQAPPLQVWIAPATSSSALRRLPHSGRSR
jgi:hypothetical protein